MKQYVIDELRYQDYEKLLAYLPKRFEAGALPFIYQIPIEPAFLTPIQSEHVDCQPYYCALELEESRLSLEFLVRSSQRIRCGCVGYAQAPLRSWLMDQIDEIFASMGLIC